MAVAGNIGISAAPPVHVDDLVEGVHDWRNIQDVVRSTFKAFYDVMKVQGEAIRGLEGAIESKAHKPEVMQRLEALESAMRRKADRNEQEEFVRPRDLQGLLARHKDEVNGALGKVLSHTQFEGWRDGLEAKIEALQREARAATDAQADLVRSQQSGATAMLELSRLLEAKADSRATNDLLATKADYSVMKDELRKKVDSEAFDAADKKMQSELVSLRGELGKMIEDLVSQKADARDLEQLARQVSRLQGSQGSVAETVDQLAGQVSRLQGSHGSVAETVDQLAGQVSRLQASHGSLSDSAEHLAGQVSRLQQQQASGAESVEQLAGQVSRLQGSQGSVAENVEQLAGQVSRLQGSTGSLADSVEQLAGQVSRLQQQQSPETARDSVASRVRAVEQALEEALRDTRLRADAASALKERLAQLEAKIGSCENMRSELSRKIDAEAVQGILGRKVDVGQMQEALAGKANAAAVEGLLDRLEDQLQQHRARHHDEMSANLAKIKEDLRSKVSLPEMKEALAGKANVSAVEGLIDRLEEREHRFRFQDDLGGQLNQLRDELRTKAAMSEIGNLLDKKANIDDVNNALAEVSNELEKKAAVTGVEALMKQQDQMRSLVSADGATARWIWKSGRTKAGGAVPWNIQTVNTDPTNLQWDRDRPTIVVVVPGLYEVTFGFFSRRKPTVQLLVNGEPVLAAVNSASYVLHHASGRLTSVGNHSSGNITGLTLIDFMALPPNAKVTLVYNGEDSGEGFLSLKKL